MSGPHDFARPLQAPSSTAPSASTTSRPTFRDVAQRPSFGTGPNDNMTGPDRRQAIFPENRKIFYEKKNPPSGGWSRRARPAAGPMAREPGIHNHERGLWICGPAP